jgi:hypothetical protein
MMKGPHFFEKRKKEMARQEKLKQKAERKAQRKAEKDKGEGGSEPEDESAEFSEIDGVNAEGADGGGQIEEEQGSEDAEAQPGGRAPAVIPEGGVRGA